MKLSLIVPGCNTPERWWRRCVESLLGAGADEIICIGDGSKARPDFLREYPVKTIFRERNEGLSAVRDDVFYVCQTAFLCSVFEANAHETPLSASF